MTTLGTKRRPILLDDDEDGGTLHPKKFARKKQLTSRRASTVYLNDSDSSDTLGEESDHDIRDSVETTTSADSSVAKLSIPSVPSAAPSAAFTFNTNDYLDDTQLQKFLRRMQLAEEEIEKEIHRKSFPSEIILEQYNFDGKLYRPGKSVEFIDGSFLRIISIVEVERKVLLRGWQFKRCATMDGLAPRRTNELCWVVNISVDEASLGATSMTIEKPLNEVKGFRIIRLTNYPYQDMSHKTAALSTKPSEGFLFCRLKHIMVWEAGRNQPVEEAVTSIAFSETDKGCGMESKKLRECWRGVTISGGSFQTTSSTVVDISSDRTSTSTTPTGNRRKYAFGDGFCGAGGVSCGARLAGLWISWGFDKSEHAMSSYRRNYPDAMCETSEVADFLTNLPEDIIVDVIHCSPPCQTFSPAKTVAGPNDDANEACIFSVRQVVERGKPRVFTMEETSGLKDRHKEFLNATIHTFVDLGYSVRWKLVDCSSYGVPQKRKRLVVIASGPGEALPPFPKPTHGPPGSGLRPYNTIGSMISRIPANAPDHTPKKFDAPKIPLSPNNLAKTITCGGGENYHPSGERGFTNREFACLQTFPLNYKFGKVEVRTQIGNAVPPMLAKALYKAIIKSLEETDGLR